MGVQSPSRLAVKAKGGKNPSAGNKKASSRRGGAKDTAGAKSRGEVPSGEACAGEERNACSTTGYPLDRPTSTRSLAVGVERKNWKVLYAVHMWCAASCVMCLPGTGEANGVLFLS